MKRLNSASFVACVGLAATLLPGCGGSESPGTGLTPFRDGWQIEADVAFDYLDGDGIPQITTLQIGTSTPINDNFMNRGDVIVEFADTPNIKIELRRFSMATNEDLAKEDYEALQLWAYAATAQKPSDEIADDDCTVGGWLNDCRIYVYYDGQTQLARAGADIRVTLPEIYRHAINISTADNATDSDYHNRGNVCVTNLNATVDIELGNARAYVSLAENTSPMPRCPAADIAECENWTDDMGNPAAWDPGCPCVNTIGEFGQVRVQSSDASASDVTVDIPGALWTSINLSNDATGQMRGAGCDATVPDNSCCATVDVPGYELDIPAVGDEASRDPWRNKGFLNHPSEAAIKGAGFNVQGTSKECAPVTATDDPADFVGANNGSMQDTAERGNLLVCTGCLRGRSCSDLLSG